MSESFGLSRTDVLARWELASHEIDQALGKRLVVAFLHNAPLVYHGNPVGIANGGHAVGDDQHRPSVH